ncbi:MAG TPA: metalloregulator ArsR/SmtB family transcription factor [Planctomycetota bacterium]|nr:metalloregulator ArsR/SmtB family transcription factor [Planctomycetota bacterium]
MTELLTLLHSPRRREILRLCWDEPRCAGAIRDALPDVTFGAVSQHLKLLRDAGLVEVEKRGRERHYRARRTALGPFRRWLEASWDDALYQLKLAAELEAARRGPAPESSPRRRPRQ